jgi:hypothetical protein
MDFRTSRLSRLLIAGSLLWLDPAAAESPVKVGRAEIVRNEVVSVGDAQLIPVNVGDDLVRDAVIRTSVNSDAKFGLVDNTKLTLGPASTLKIDSAVFTNESRYKQITLRLSEGAFRFISGNSDKKSYKIETPYAVIGVRGTILDIRISQNQTLVALQDGAASVCAGNRCTQLLERGQTANVTRQGDITNIRRELTPSWTFASVCAGNSALCSPLPALVKKANLTPPSLPKPGKKPAIGGTCPDGLPMVGNSCGMPLNPARAAAGLPDTSLPLLGSSRGAPLPSGNNIGLPGLDSTLGRTNGPSIGPGISPLRR